jgi:tRNA pseudouridine55 synthase
LNLEFYAMDGILNVNKPKGLTSFDVVARIKRISQQRHSGHAGTLDPQATGVLPICLGQATRVIEFLFNETKTYRTQVELGITTDTYDLTGKVTRTADASGINRDMVESALNQFRGAILQTPPMYSALKYQGQPLYKLARSGIEVARKSRPVNIYTLEIVAWHPPLVTLDVICGKGTYIRSLAHDLGEKLGCGGSMKRLVRLKVGPFSLEEALTLPQLEEAFHTGIGEKYLYPLDFVLFPFNALVVKKEQESSLIHGAPISLVLTVGAGPQISPGMLCRVYTEDGGFLGMVRYETEDSRWHPEKIFFKECRQACHSPALKTEDTPYPSSAIPSSDDIQ